MSKYLLLARPGHIYLAKYSSTAISIVFDLSFQGNPSWLALHPSDPSVLYAVDEDTTTLHRFRLDVSSPSEPFTQHETISNAGLGSVYLEFNHATTPSQLLAASFSGGTVDVYDIAKFGRATQGPIHSDGELGPI